MNDIQLLEDRLHRVNNFPMLLLGAGFSLGGISAAGNELMLGKGVAQALFDVVLKTQISAMKEDMREDCEYYRKRGNLREICNIIRRENCVDERNHYFMKTMSGCNPKIIDASSQDYVDFDALTTYPWPFIFTMNIDDLVERTYDRMSKPYTVWVRKEKKYEMDPNGTTIVKLHGCVNKDVEHFVFCDDEYNDFIRPDNVMLERFGNEAFARDVIIVGTQFQERDLKNTIGSLIDRGCSGKNCHYFFVSPGEYDKEISSWIDSYSNFHHIKWTNSEFLRFLRKLKAVNHSKKELLTGNYYTCWNDELEEARNAGRQGKNDHELYYGRRPIARDFVNQFDIDRFSDERIYVNKDFINKVNTGNSFIAVISGNTYVGKTCLGLRLLTICAENSFTCFYTRSLDFDSVQRLKAYIDTISSEEKLAVCLEDAAGCYHNFEDLFRSGEKLKQLITDSC